MGTAPVRMEGWWWLRDWGQESLKTSSLTQVVTVGGWRGTVPEVSDPAFTHRLSLWPKLPHSLMAGFKGEHLKKTQAGAVRNFMT